VQSDPPGRLDDPGADFEQAEPDCRCLRAGVFGFFGRDLDSVD